jgi:hypothetical protein
MQNASKPGAKDVKTDADSKQSVAPTGRQFFQDQILAVLGNRFSSWQAAVTLVTDLHSESDDVPYPKRLQHIHGAILPLIPQVCDRTSLFFLLCLCFSTF